MIPSTGSKCFPITLVNKLLNDSKKHPIYSSQNTKNNEVFNIQFWFDLLGFHYFKAAFLIILSYCISVDLRETINHTVE